PTAIDDCPGTTVECSPASGSCFVLGTTTVTCTVIDAAGNVASCAFSVTVRTTTATQCPKGQGYWKNNVAAWPLNSLTLGGQTYTQSELVSLLKLPVKGDASVLVARQLIAAKLNIANGSDPVPINSTIQHA